MILLDTEALIWVDQDDERLGGETREIVTAALDRNELGVSTISFWEIAWLIRKQRIDMGIGMSEWRNGLLDAGVQEIPVNGLIGIPGDDALQGEYLSTAGAAINEVSKSLSSPRDQLITTAPHLLVSLIAATAMRLEATMVTSDEQVLEWSGSLTRHDARH